MKNLLIICFIILLTSPVLANNQGVESAKCDTQIFFDAFNTQSQICMRFTTDGRACNVVKGQPIYIYVIPHQSLSFYQDGVSFLDIATRGLSTAVNSIADPPYIFTNLGANYLDGGYDIVFNPTKDGKYHAGDCIDQQGSPIYNAGFDIGERTTTTSSTTTSTTLFICNEGETRCGETDIDFLEKCIGNKWYYQETCMFGCTSGICNPPITTTSSTTTTLSVTTTTQPEVTTTTIFPTTTTTLAPPTIGGQNMTWLIILFLIISAIIYYFREKIRLC